MRRLQVIDRTGPEEFSATLSVQTNLLTAKIADPELDDVLILVEHQEVYTVGRAAAMQQPAEAPARDVRWVEIGRGGDATFHGPGQLVAYPIFDLTRHGRDVHLFLRALERAGIAALARCGVTAYTRPGLTGIWVRDGTAAERKIGSIGIGVKRWVSYHGLALNVTTDLSYFRAISACGQSGRVMTSLAELSGTPPAMAEVKAALVEEMRREFGFAEEDAQGADAVLPAALARRARPAWLRVKAPGSPQFQETKEIIKQQKLVTVCEEARCPNMGECWSHHTATFMIMGDLCTRRCSFCSVKDGTLGSLKELDALEPLRAAQAVARLKLKHVVITSVNRDDLPDMGAEHFDRTVRAIRHLNPETEIELLIPDMRGRRELVATVLGSGLVRVLNHNVETVPRLYREVRPGAVFARSLNVLRWARELAPGVRTKSGLMVGLGETRAEVLEVMDELRRAEVQVLTIGQYLQPTAKQLPIQRYVTPEEFADYQREGERRGFLHVESGPLVRSSYHAWQHTGKDSIPPPAPVWA